MKAKEGEAKAEKAKEKEVLQQQREADKVRYLVITPMAAAAAGGG